MELGEHIVQSAAAAGEISFQDQVAERFECEDMLHKKSKGARGVRFPLARAPGVLLAETLCEAGSDGRTGEQAFGGTEGLAASAGVDDLQPGVDRLGER